VDTAVAAVKRKAWLIRALIAPVVFFNLQCSFEFLVHAQRYAPSFDLNEQTGAYMIQGFGLLFLMWNIPYLTALADPIRHATSLTEAVVMQAIGAVGEALLLLNVPAEYQNLHASVSRFIYFDAGGLLFLLAAWLFRRRIK
jgi:hypothetical protein